MPCYYCTGLKSAWNRIVSRGPKVVGSSLMQTQAKVHAFSAACALKQLGTPCVAWILPWGLNDFAWSASSDLSARSQHVIDLCHCLSCRMMRQVSTMRRLALTGYPLQNKLEEYYQMILWVSTTCVTCQSRTPYSVCGVHVGTLVSPRFRKYSCSQLPGQHDHTSELNKIICFLHQLS